MAFLAYPVAFYCSVCRYMNKKRRTLQPEELNVHFCCIKTSTMFTIISY